MKKSQIIVVCVSLAVGYIAATSFNRTSAGQPPAPQPVGQEVAVWRYQLTVPIEGIYDGYAILTDTATGHCWKRYHNEDKWEDLGSPTGQK
jgi:hypothetical protein